MVLGRAFNAIRFPLMSVEEFAMGPAQSGLLDDREIVQLFLYFTVNPKPNVGFLDTPRCCMTGKELTVNRFPQTESRWGYSGTTDRIRFTVDQRIFVVGFGLYGSYFGPTEYEVHLQVRGIIIIGSVSYRDFKLLMQIAEWLIMPTSVVRDVLRVPLRENICMIYKCLFYLSLAG